ncbi:MAG: AAA family ATPase [Saprospiraceae bacterium]
MKVKKIKIENFRGILDAELEFDDRLNVFIGRNGAGKTTILDAIGKCIFDLIKTFTGESNENIFNSNDNINYGARYFLIDSQISTDFHPSLLDIYVHEGYLNSIEIRESAIDKFFNSLNEIVKTREVTIPIFKYYSRKRNTTYGVVMGKIIKTFPIPQLETWDNIYQDEVTYHKFVKWFFDNESKELRLRRDTKNEKAEIRTLTYVRKAVQAALRELEDINFSIKSDQVKRKYSNDLIPTLVIENLETGVAEDLNNKSDGEKAIITLVADIAYNLSIAKDFSEGDDYLNSPGIVLIDEIEAHLHPEWQRKIIPLLTELFPNIQFFITTHSPQVISTVESQHIFIGENFKFSKINIKSKGLDSNQILKYVFNTTERPREYIDLIEQFDQTIDNQGDIQELESIVTKIDALDEGDNGRDIDMLIEELNLRIEAYKYDLAHEAHS